MTNREPDAWPTGIGAITLFADVPRQACTNPGCPFTTRTPTRPCSFGDTLVSLLKA
jgi:hypothetical protein